MFGISAFAQSPFASLGTNAYALSITEAQTIADSNTQASAFLRISYGIIPYNLT